MTYLSNVHKIGTIVGKGVLTMNFASPEMTYIDPHDIFILLIYHHNVEKLVFLTFCLTSAQFYGRLCVV